MNTENNDNKILKARGVPRVYIGSLVVLLGVVAVLAYFQLTPETESIQVSESIAEVVTEPVEKTLPISENGLAKVVVYKSPTCNCCSKWVEHLRGEGFEVETHDRENMKWIKAEFGISRPLQSCHTAVVEGYTIEGHVPADDIKRLLKDKPEVAGLSVPGMPIGSPGMEADFIEPYDVIAFDKQGNSETFAEYRVDGKEYVKNSN